MQWPTPLQPARFVRRENRFRAIVERDGQLLTAHVPNSGRLGELAPGDILGFRGWGHVGLYAGGDDFIHAPQSGDVVKVSSLSARSNYCGAVRP